MSSENSICVIKGKEFIRTMQNSVDAQIPKGALASNTHAEESDMNTKSFVRVMAEQMEEERRILIDSDAVDIDFSAIRGIPSPDNELASKPRRTENHPVLPVQLSQFAEEAMEEEEGDLDGLAELVPALKTIKSSPVHGSVSSVEMDSYKNRLPHYDSMVAHNGAAVDRDGGVEADTHPEEKWNSPVPMGPNGVLPEEYQNEDASESESSSENQTANELLQKHEQKDNSPVMKHTSAPIKGCSSHSSSTSSAGQTHASDDDANVMPIQNSVEPIVQYSATAIDRSNPKPYHAQRDITPPPHNRESIDDSFMTSKTPSPNRGGDYPPQSSVASLSTATKSNDLHMPMYLPNFRPATGCTNASDFIVRCFVARLRSGITVVKHGRSRWCKSRLRYVCYYLHEGHSKISTDSRNLLLF